ncbi:adenosine deaminase AGSA-like [Physella acuta]|uniref:adenosine deaminase AGSA-like n=1 Tax=Physella acuta TaxID=109671 RepID=UPI0027DB5A92|nr:adenosine deaminase AGSA-like [Physella acuta]
MSPYLLGYSMLVCVLSVSHVAHSLTSSEYLQLREEILLKEKQRMLGGQITLTPDEQLVNQILMKEKTQQIEDSRYKNVPFLAAQNFLDVKERIENTEVYNIIHRMPKGGALHIHDISSVGAEWLITNVTYRDDIYMCVTEAGDIRYQAFLDPPSQLDCQWKSVQAERWSSPDVTQFDEKLINNIVPKLNNFCSDKTDELPIGSIARYLAQALPLITYLPVFMDYYRKTLEDLRSDNVQYLELRSSISQVYDIDGKIYDKEQIVIILKRLTEEFVNRYDGFIGAKIIITGDRTASKEQMLADVKSALDLHQRYPDFVAGFDLAASSGNYNPVVYYMDALLYPTNLDPPATLPYFLHAGETKWFGVELDQDILDVLLLNTTRVGHGFTLSKHPEYVDIIRDSNIAVEVNPISNQILCLVSDLRSHPMVGLMADNLPVVISSDDPGIFRTDPLSHDFYMAFMAMAPKSGDLAFLKQLAINSIQYSAMSAREKEAAFVQWTSSWDIFIQSVVKEISQAPQ